MRGMSSSGCARRFLPTRWLPYMASRSTAPSGACWARDVEIRISAWDETNTRLRPERIIRQIRAGGGRGLVALVGVQSNQFPRAVDIARPLRAAGVPVCIGEFHVSGCLAMLPDMPPDLRAALDLGITLFVGEAEGRLDDLLQAACAGKLEPVYNFMNDLPGLEGAPVPFLPASVVRRTSGVRTSFDAGRGCPFRAASARSSTCRGGSRAIAAPTTSSASCAQIWRRASAASSSRTTTWRVIRTGRRSSTGSSSCAKRKDSVYA